MEKHPEIKEIYHRFLRNEANAAELDLLFAYFEAGDAAPLRALIGTALNTAVEEEAADLRRSRHLANLHESINSRIDVLSAPKVVSIGKKPLRGGYFNTTLFKIAASVLLVAFLGFYGYQYLKPITADIPPGGNYATLQTADGERIDLKVAANATVAKIQGVTIRKTADGQIVYTAVNDQKASAVTWNSIVTPMGGRYRITLSDGTIVFLNSGSKLDFPVGFHGPERRVKLTGEAYFEVTKDPSMPFIVESGKAVTKVLGTRFNVSNYADDAQIRTTLLEGKVSFNRMGDEAPVLLKPNEQAVLKGDHIQVLPVNAEDYMSWKDNRFVFRNESLDVIMRQLSRWYDIEVDYNSLPDRRLYANIGSDTNLSEVLRMLSVTSDLKFKIEGRRVSVMR